MDKQEISTIEIIMIKEMIKIDIGQIVEIGEYHSVVEYNMDRIIKTDQGIIRTIDVTLEEEILEDICDPQIRIMEVKFLEVDTEGITEVIKEAGVDLGIDDTQIIPG